MIIVNGFQPLTIITKCPILDVTAVLDPPLLSKNEPSILMHIVWSRVSAPNLVRSTDSSLFIQEKPCSQLVVLLLIAIIIKSKTVPPPVSPHLQQINSLHTPIIGVCLDLIFFSQNNNGQCFLASFCSS